MSRGQLHRENALCVTLEDQRSKKRNQQALPHVLTEQRKKQDCVVCILLYHIEFFFNPRYGFVIVYWWVTWHIEQTCVPLNEQINFDAKPTDTIFSWSLFSWAVNASLLGFLAAFVTGASLPEVLSSNWLCFVLVCFYHFCRWLALLLVFWGSLLTLTGLVLTACN